MYRSGGSSHSSTSGEVPDILLSIKKKKDESYEFQRSVPSWDPTEKGGKHSQMRIPLKKRLSSFEQERMDHDNSPFNQRGSSAETSEHYHEPHREPQVQALTSTTAQLLAQTHPYLHPQSLLLLQQQQEHLSLQREIIRRRLAQQFAGPSPASKLHRHSLESNGTASSSSTVAMGMSTDAVASMHATSDPIDTKSFRPYQKDQWHERFQELLLYKEKHGDCLVPHSYPENMALARWVKRQRYQHKLWSQGKASNISQARVELLEENGFIWDSQNASWYERLSELKAFRRRFNHCNVPSNFTENKQLATWVKCQRRNYKFFIAGKPSNITRERIHHLETIGFEWELRKFRKKGESGSVISTDASSCVE